MMLLSCKEFKSPLRLKRLLEQERKKINIIISLQKDWDIYMDLFQQLVKKGK